MSEDHLADRPLPSVEHGAVTRSSRSDGPFAQIVLLRHGATQWSSSGRHTGRSDIELDELGRRQAEQLAGHLSGEHFSLVLSSPLKRAVETAELAGLGEALVLLEDLMEWDYGSYEGLTTEQIRHERPGWELFRDGCPGGERAAEVGRRADRVLDSLALSPEAEDALVIVAHGHLLRVLTARYLGLSPADGRLFVLDPAALAILAFEREVRVLRRWNQEP